MKYLHFDYRMTIEYESDVNRCNYTIKCFPRDTTRQKISELKLSLTPEHESEWGVDHFGNNYAFGCDETVHKEFVFSVTGYAKTGLSDYELIADDNEIMIHRHAFGMNKAGVRLKEFYKNTMEKAQVDKTDAISVAECFMKELYEYMIYEPLSTTLTTTAEEAFALGRGVCQDYAHIMISLLNLAGFSARYVTGFLIGEGATHAWVEVEKDKKWYGFDPTNNIRVDDLHIRIGSGRDASDCLINKGIVRGGGSQKQSVMVTVKELGTGFGLLNEGIL